VITIASNAGLTGYGYTAAYCAAKHAVIGMTRALAVDLGRTGVTINAVCPGWVDDPTWPTTRSRGSPPRPAAAPTAARAALTRHESRSAA
jgi:NAD(P)-dependent dehydrogenase (short-subunit alcohol dehydrogenase family)